MEIKNDFQLKHATMLLEYKTYLLYDVQIKLASYDAFFAINYFLAKVKGRISYQFFRRVDAHLNKDSVDLYNKFVKRYLQKGFKIENLNVRVIKALKEIKL